MKHFLFTSALLIACSLHATVVSFDYFGTVTGVQGQPEPKFGGLVAGDAIKGTFTYDTAAINQGDVITAQYIVISQSLQLGAFTYSPTNSSIHINADNGYYWWMTGLGAGYSMNLNLYDSIAPYLQNDTLLRPPPDILSVDQHSGSMNFLNGNEGERTHLNFNLESVVLHSSTVPDTGGTLTFTAVSFAALLFRRRSIGLTF